MRAKYVMRWAKLVPLTDYNNYHTSAQNYQTVIVPAIVKTQRKLLLLIKYNSTLHVPI